MTFHRAVAPAKGHCRVDRRFVAADALGEMTDLRAKADLGSRQPLLQRAGRSFTDQGRELVREVQGDRQIGAGRAELVQADLGLGRTFLGATDPVE